MRKMMLTLTVLILLAGGAISGMAQETVNGSIMHDDIEREYLLYIPDSYTGTIPVPLVFNFHGHGSLPGIQMQYGDFRPIADRVGFLVVHPEGTLYEGDTHWNLGLTPGSTVDDVGFTAALIDHLSSGYNIDSRRIYSTGFSMGGYMSFLLACQLSERFAAIASVSGSMTPETYDEANPQHPTPVMQIHGTADTTIPYDGTPWSESIEVVLQYWVDYDHCHPTPIVTDMPDIDPDDGSTVERIVYYDGDDGVTVEHFKVLGGGHTWPGSTYGVPVDTNFDINASEEIWRFFSRYDIDGITDLPRLLVGPGPNEENPPLVCLFQLESMAAAEFEFPAYGASSYGVNVSCGDMDGDLKDEILTGAGPGDIYGPHVRGFKYHGSAAVQLAGLNFLAYGTNKYGVNVAAGDIDADGFDEIITGAGPGAVFGPHVRAFDYDGTPGVNPVPGVSYFAYGTPKWGVNVSAGDIDGDGYDEIVTGAGPGAVYGPHVRGWNVDGGAAAAMPDCSFFAYGTFRMGVNVTCGDVDGDGIDEIITGPGPSSYFGAHVRGFEMNGSPLPELSFFAWPPDEVRYGANVFAGADLNGNGRNEIVVGQGPDPEANGEVKVFEYDESQVSEWFWLETFPGMTHGTNVAAGRF